MRGRVHPHHRGDGGRGADPISVMRPDGAGPFPAVVIMQAPEGDVRPTRDGFVAAVALYPSCAPGARVWRNTSGG